MNICPVLIGIVKLYKAALRIVVIGTCNSLDASNGDSYSAITSNSSFKNNTGLRSVFIFIRPTSILLGSLPIEYLNIYFPKCQLPYFKESDTPTRFMFNPLAHSFRELKRPIKVPLLLYATTGLITICLPFSTPQSGIFHPIFLLYSETLLDDFFLYSPEWVLP